MEENGIPVGTLNTFFKCKHLFILLTISNYDYGCYLCPITYNIIKRSSHKTFYYLVLKYNKRKADRVKMFSFFLFVVVVVNF